MRIGFLKSWKGIFMVALAAGGFLWAVNTAHATPLTHLVKQPQPSSTVVAASTPAATSLSTVNNGAELTLDKAGSVAGVTTAADSSTLQQSEKSRCNAASLKMQYDTVYKLQVLSEAQVHDSWKSTASTGSADYVQQLDKETTRHAGALSNIESNYHKNIASIACK
jgi:hypothetical protein